jgi:hypothetical protein
LQAETYSIIFLCFDQDVIPGTFPATFFLPQVTAIVNIAQGKNAVNTNFIFSLPENSYSKKTFFPLPCRSFISLKNNRPSGL